MTTWTPVSSPSSAWSKENIPIRIFSPHVYSFAFFGGRRVFSGNTTAGFWVPESGPSSSWTPK